MSLFHNDLGIDLGTANSLVYIKGKGIVLNEPSVVAINQKTGHLLAVGREAKQMVGRTPGHIVAIRPLINGVISDFEITQEMLRYFLKKSQGKIGGLFNKRNRVVIGVPCELTEVERKAVEDASRNAGAKEVYLVEEPLAAAIGMRLPIHEPVGNVVIDIGGGTSDIAVISLGGIVHSVSLKVAGDRFNEDITRFVKDKCKLLIGEPTAEEIKMTIGSAYDTPEVEEQEMTIQGKDMTSGLPRVSAVGTREVRMALQKSLELLVSATKSTIEKSPPELVGDLMERGIYLSGGGSLLRGIDVLMAREIGVPVHITDDPLTTVVRGTGIIIENLDTLRPILLNEKIPRSAIG